MGSAANVFASGVMAHSDVVSVASKRMNAGNDNPTLDDIFRGKQ